MSTGGIVFIVIVVAVILLVIQVFNRLVALKNLFQNAFAQIDVQLKRRYDLIPNLVETAKSYLKHERETLEAVITARNNAMAGLQKATAGDQQSMQSLNQAEGQLGGALGRLNMVMEAYPDLKANTNMMQLTEELSSTENKISFARQAYNDAVMQYNTYKQSFPAVFFAGLFGHQQDATTLEFEDRASLQQAPKVSFD